MSIGLPAIMLLLALGMALAMGFAWRTAERRGTHAHIDAVWTVSTGLACVIGALMPLETSWLPRRLAVAGIAALWSLRLGSHMIARARAARDDPRYAALRAGWGENAARRLFLFLQIQALAGFILVLAVTAAAQRPGDGLRLADLLGVALALLAIAGAGLADRQLALFRADPAHRGRICEQGLWRFTRHPNYFFEWLGWLAYPVIGLEGLRDYPFGVLTLSAPLLIYVILVHGSGIPPTEAHMRATRGEPFRDYQRRVNAFWPGPPRR